MTKGLIAALLILVVSPLALRAQADDRGEAEAIVKFNRVRITYGKPTLAGRDSWDMFNRAPVGTVWRTGTNDATEISTTGAVNVAGTRLSAGRYSLWVRKLGKDQWSLSFHPKTGIPGIPELKEGFVAETPLALTHVSTFNDELLILLTPKGSEVGISIFWGNSRLEGVFAIVD